jgi:hypothetical protein
MRGADLDRRHRSALVLGTGRVCAHGAAPGEVANGGSGASRAITIEDAVRRRGGS